MPPVMFSVVTKYHKGGIPLFLYNSEIFYAFTQDILLPSFSLNQTSCEMKIQNLPVRFQKLFQSISNTARGRFHGFFLTLPIQKVNHVWD